MGPSADAAANAAANSHAAPIRITGCEINSAISRGLSGGAKSIDCEVVHAPGFANINARMFFQIKGADFAAKAGCPLFILREIGDGTNSRLARQKGSPKRVDIQTDIGDCAESSDHDAAKRDGSHGNILGERD
jgi:hypothetical protein